MSEQEKQVHPLVALKSDLDRRSEEFAAALPSHMPVERFRRVILTAVQRNPKLLHADRRSFWNAAMQAAQDGLLPDGREGAMVIYKTNVAPKGEPKKWADMVQWMPMIFGILKKIRNSGELAAITARIVYGGDKFRYWVDDDGEHILFEPAETPDTTIVRRVFAMAKTKDGAVYAEPMTIAEIEKVRQSSKAKDSGPWVDWWDQMAQKTVLRRLSKRLPMSSDLDDLIRRDDALYDMDGTSDRVIKPRQTIAEKFDALAGIGHNSVAIEHKPGVPFSMTTDREAQEEYADNVREAHATGSRQTERDDEPQREDQKTRAKRDPKSAQSQRNATSDQMEAEARVRGKIDTEKEKEANRVAERSGLQARETIENEPDPAASDEQDDNGDDRGDAPREETPRDRAYNKGYADRREGRSRKAAPKFETKSEAEGWIDGWEMADAEAEG